MSSAEWSRTARDREVLAAAVGRLPWLMLSAADRDGLTRKAHAGGNVADEARRLAESRVRKAGHEPFW